MKHADDLEGRSAQDDGRVIRLRIEEVARWHGVSPGTLYRYIRCLGVAAELGTPMRITLMRAHELIRSARDRDGSCVRKSLCKRVLVPKDDLVEIRALLARRTLVSMDRKEVMLGKLSRWIDPLLRIVVFVPKSWVAPVRMAAKLLRESEGAERDLRAFVEKHESGRHDGATTDPPHPPESKPPAPPAARVARHRRRRRRGK